MNPLVTTSHGSLDSEPVGQMQTPSNNAAPQQSTDLLALAWQGRWLILIGVLIGGAVAWVCLQRTTPLYESMSRIYVERSLPKLLSSDMQFGQSNSYLFTQAELLKSSGVLLAVSESPMAASMETFRDVDDRVGMLYEALNVGVGQDDEIINVSLELPNPVEAAQLVNAIVNEYIEQYAEKNSNDTAKVLEILKGEKIRRDNLLTEARRELTAFRDANPELAVQVDNQDVASDRFSRLMTELNQTEFDQLTAKAEYERVREMAASPTLRPLLLDMALDSIGKSDLNDDLEALVTKQQEIELLLLAEQAKWGDAYPTVKSLKRSLEQAEKRIVAKKETIAAEKEAALRAYAFNVKERFEFHNNKLNGLRSKYQDQFEAAKDSSANALKLYSLEEVYDRAVADSDQVEQRIKELDLNTQVGAMNVSIIETAKAPLLPSSPSRAKFLGAGIMLGGLCGFGLAWLRDMLDHRLKSVDEIQELLQLQVFGAVRRQLGRIGREELGRLVHLQPRSTSAEAFRTLRTAVHFGLAGDDCKVLVVTSPSPGDGKSVVTSNLAIATDQADRRTLLIDADMRKPTQHTIFGVDNSQGLSTALSERRPVEELIVPGVADTLDFLPAGPTPSNPLELLNNDYFVDMLERLKPKYDRIIIDSPPVMPVADSRVIASMSDAVLLVLRAEKSTRRISLAARDELWRVRAQRLGIVVNAVPQSKGGSYGYGYGYGYGGYGNYGEVAYGHDDQRSLGSRKKRLIQAREEHPAVVEQP